MLERVEEADELESRVEDVEELEERVENADELERVEEDDELLEVVELGLDVELEGVCDREVDDDLVADAVGRVVDDERWDEDDDGRVDGRLEDGKLDDENTEDVELGVNVSADVVDVYSVVRDPGLLGVPEGQIVFVLVVAVDVITIVVMINLLRSGSCDLNAAGLGPRHRQTWPYDCPGTHVASWMSRQKSRGRRA